MLVVDAAKQALNISIRVEKLRAEMIKLAKQTPEFPAVIELYGVGGTLASKLIAEIGDPRRFVDKWALVAYAGVDPSKDDSGKKATKRGKISRTGDALLAKRLIKSLSAICLTRSPMSLCINSLIKNGLKASVILSI